MRFILLVFTVFVSSLVAHSQTQGWFTYDTTTSAIPSNLVTSVKADNQNAIWIGTVNGLAKFEDFFNWTIWKESNSNLPDDWITCLNIDNSGRVWIGTLSGGVAVLQNNVFTVYNTQNSPLTSNNITSINFQSNVAWITTDGGGLYSFNGTNWINYNSSNTGFQIDVCYDVAIDGAGNKWIGTLSDGLLKLSGSIFTSFNPTDSDIPFEFVRSVAIENDTTIWVGMGYTGTDSSLTRFNGSTTFTTYSAAQANGIHFKNVWDILVDNGEKWICTNDLDHGVIKYNDTTFTDYSSFNSGLPFNRVYAVAKDTGNLWFATMRGLAVFNERNAFLAVPENAPLMVASVYPNPTTEIITVSLASNIHQARVSIYTADGRLAMNKQLNQVNEGRATLFVEELKAGFYFAVMQAQGRSDYFKFIKQ